MAKQKLGPNQKRWLKALESGRYKQTKNALLAELNDEGKKFKEIAAIIRSDPANYFKGPR